MEINYFERKCSVKEDEMKLKLIDKSNNKIKVDLIFLKDKEKSDATLECIKDLFSNIYY